MNANDLLSSNIEVVSSCLEGGVDPNALVGRDADDIRALAVQCFSGHVEIVRLLLANGADPNLGRASTGETPLHHAVLDEGSSQLEIVTALLSAGADPNKRCGVGVLSVNFMRDVRVRGETPLHRAAIYADTEIIQALFDSGARKELKDANGDSPLAWASLCGRDLDILRLLCYGDIRV